jgi:hypothetical protein
MDGMKPVANIIGILIGGAILYFMFKMATNPGFFL